MYSSETCVRLLLGETLTQIKKEEGQEWVNARDISGCTPLLYCLNNKNRVLEKVSEITKWGSKHLHQFTLSLLLHSCWYHMGLFSLKHWMGDSWNIVITPVTDMHGGIIKISAI